MRGVSRHFRPAEKLLLHVSNRYIPVAPIVPLTVYYIMFVRLDCFQKIAKMRKNNCLPAVKAHTLGCKVNFCDTNALVEALVSAGFRRAAEGRPAAVEIVNTCAVTARSVQKARGLIRRIRAANPHALLVTTGCAVRMREKALLTMPETDVFCPFPEDAAALLCRRWGLRPVKLLGGFDPARTRAFLKVQDGCSASCAYCVVPFVRPNPRSVPPPQVLRRFKQALDGGYREIVLSGTHLGRYGRGTADGTLAALLRQIASFGGGFRVRMSSIEPLEVTDELLDVMGSSEIFCPHLHVPLQSGSNRILAAMRRPYTRERFLDTLERARSALSNPAITTDVMAGFPGESHQDHRETLRIVEEAGFARAHVFVFSPRPGTAAARFAGRVDGRQARLRSGEIRALCERSARDFRRSLVSLKATVLAEKEVDGHLEGFCARYQRVRFRGGRELLGILAPVHIIGDNAAEQTVLQARL